MRRLALIAVLMLTACGETAAPTPSEEESFTIEGTFTLTDFARIQVTDDGCSGTGGYDDVQSGMRVLVTDQSGEAVGTGSTQAMTEGNTVSICRLTFSVEVPRSDFYTIAVGNRGELTYSFDELESADWGVAFELG